MSKFIITDADGDVITDEPTRDAALHTRARLMSEHPDGDDVTIEVVP